MQIIFLIKYLRKSCRCTAVLLKLNSFIHIFAEYLFRYQSKSICFAENRLVAVSEKREFKHMSQARKKDSLSLIFKKVLTRVNKDIIKHYSQISLKNIVVTRNVNN